jgi:CO/xanthine dehydrogenase Mo-binding subunit
VGDAGPYGGAPTIAPFVALSGSGPYIWGAIDFEVRVAHTNGGNAGPLRGYGMPHGVLGLECSLDELAAELGVDPWQLRWLNAADETTGACTGQPFDEPFGFRSVLQAIKPEWERAQAAAREHRARPAGDDVRGVGLASSWYQFGKSGELRVSAEVELGLDGTLGLYFCAMNSGQGLNTVMGQLAADELRLPRERIRLVNSDTDCTVDSHVYGAAKTTYWVGGAVVEASRKLKNAMLDVVAEKLALPSHHLRIAENGVRVEGDAGRTLTLQEVAAELETRGLPRRYVGVFDLEERYAQDGRPRYLGHFAVGTALADVSVNLKTGKVKVLRIVVAQDVGRAINPLDVRGQIEGAAMMELGAALMEEYVPGQTLDFKRYRIPRMRDLPDLKVIIVEVPGRDGPHGVKGVGEAAAGCVRAAILNAINDAIGARVRHLPATPERVLEALRGASLSQEGE